MPSPLARSLVVLAALFVLSCDDKSGSSTPEVATASSGPRGMAPAARLPPPLKASHALRAAVAAALSGATLTPISVDPATRHKLCDDPTAATREVRIVPQAPDESPRRPDAPWAGVRLFGVRADAVVAKLGLMNGDLVLAVDEIPIDSPADASLATDRMCRATSVTVHVVRRADAGGIDLLLNLEGSDGG